MIKNILKKLQYISIVIVGISLVAGCSQSIKPFDGSTLGQITFSFSDNDNDKGEIGGDITLEIPANLIPAQLADFVIYWGTSPNANGKAELLATVPSAGFNPPVLYTVPENTAIAEEYFLLFLRAKDGKEVFSGKASLAADRYEGVQVPEVTDVTQEPPPEEKPEQAADQPESTPSTTETTPSASQETPSASTEQTQVSPDQGAQMDNVVMVPIKNVLFEFDKSYLRPEFKAELDEELGKITDKENTRLLIAGHADERGSNEYNLALGERRAFSVKRYLISMGFQADNIRIISYGEEKPIDPGHNEEAWRKNRRAESEIQ